MKKEAFVLTVLVFLLLAGGIWWLVDGGYQILKDYFFVENVFIQTDYDEVVVSRPTNAIHLVISGEVNIVSVSSDTRLKVLEIDGNDNNFTLCEGIHSPELIDSGERNSIVYSSC